MTSLQAGNGLMLSFVTPREDDAKSITKNNKTAAFSFSLFFLVGTTLSLCNSVHDYSLCTVIPCMIMPLLFRQQIWRLTFFFSFSLLVDTGTLWY